MEVPLSSPDGLYLRGTKLKKKKKLFLFYFEFWECGYFCG
jgi:hypothetical protein